LEEDIAIVRYRYVFFLNWSSYVSPNILRAAECVNFHCTVLPYGRGGGPIENLILRGHTETVITAHRMVEELDAGPIYAQSGPVSLAGTKAEILDRFVEPVVSMIRQIVTEEPEPYPQVGEVVRFSRLPKAEMEALWAARS
jgi:methionyl-tRNA formyltransferase